MWGTRRHSPHEQRRGTAWKILITTAGSTWSSPLSSVAMSFITTMRRHVYDRTRQAGLSATGGSYNQTDYKTTPLISSSCAAAGISDAEFAAQKQGAGLSDVTGPGGLACPLSHATAAWRLRTRFVDFFVGQRKRSGQLLKQSRVMGLSRRRGGAGVRKWPFTKGVSGATTTKTVFRTSTGPITDSRTSCITTTALARLPTRRPPKEKAGLPREKWGDNRSISFPTWLLAGIRTEFQRRHEKIFERAVVVVVVW